MQIDNFTKQATLICCNLYTLVSPELLASLAFMSQQQKPRAHHDHPSSIQPGDVYPSTDKLTAHQARDAVMSRDAVKPDDHSLDVRESELGGRCVVTASASNQVLAQYTVPEPIGADKTVGAFTIGQALEAAARTAGDKPIDKADAAAVQAAEAKATRHGNLTQGGIGATAQVAAEANAIMDEGEEKVFIQDVLTSATKMLPRDKAVTRDDAKRVKDAEMRNKGEGHVADAVATAARLNEKRV